jgi:hypothetical protein
MSSKKNKPVSQTIENAVESAADAVEEAIDSMTEATTETSEPSSNDEEIIDSDFTESDCDSTSFEPNIDPETIRRLMETGFIHNPQPEKQGGTTMEGNNFEALINQLMSGEDMTNIDPGTRQMLIFYIKQLLMSGAIREDDLIEVRRQADYEKTQRKREEKRAEKEREKAEREASKGERKHLSTGAKIAIAVGITAGVLVIGGVTWYIIKKKVDEKRATQELCYDTEGKLRMLTDNIDLSRHIGNAVTSGCDASVAAEKFGALLGI